MEIALYTVCDHASGIIRGLQIKVFSSLAY